MKMSARQAVEKYGNSLVGNVVLTPRWEGGFEGGLCQVTEMGTDPEAPEIVFHVKRVSDGDQCGVFEHEEVELYPDGFQSTLKEAKSEIQDTSANPRGI